MNKILKGSFITTFKIPSSWRKTNPFEMITHALLGVHKSNNAERGGAQRAPVPRTNLFINLQQDGSFAEMQSRKLLFVCTFT